MFRLSKFIKSFGSIKDLTNWDTEVLKQSKPILVDFHATYNKMIKIKDGVVHVKDLLQYLKD